MMSAGLTELDHLSVPIGDSLDLLLFFSKVFWLKAALIALLHHIFLCFSCFNALTQLVK